MKKSGMGLVMICAIGILVLIGCATPKPGTPEYNAMLRHPSASQGTGTPTANPALGVQFKQAEIPAGKAVVYIYRPEGYGKGGLAMPFGVMVNGKDITTLIEGGYYAYICDPGQIAFVVHEIGFMAPKDTSSVSVNAEAGQAYYLKGSHGKGAIGRAHLESVSPATGSSEITGCKQITAQ